MELLKAEANNNQTLHVQLFGDFDAKGSREAQTEIDHIIHNDGHHEVEVDLKQVHFMDSSGIGAIVYLYKRLVERERVMRIENATGQPLQIMKLLRIGQAIPINTHVSNEYL
ncbi:anti-anti-sigma factor [Vibrio sp. 10N.286.49.C2]|uniref:STAS domain-containing protein n=1 Tax=unclassified Vibrio TaxID=2614977 RepID=UPI000C83E98C|nr:MULTISPECIES: STAS domain-containing protein [unclassified Vibrio]PMH31428.1 anti-anti-sigma factor [Vibrio sp. 10N.286.49.C2]PMH50449.1 anti-anti-sigma factor [Vibrio sp. 10N.286.49.B1]PMH78068.1 anti-anti-sigma factor [Vibrio sp. 10N.286.48.B7]